MVIGASLFAVPSAAAHPAFRPVAGSPFPAGSQPDALAFSPNGKLLATADSGWNTVEVFSVSSSGALTPVTGPPTSTGSTPSSVAFSPDGRLLAVANSLDNTISIFSVATRTGALTPVSGSPFHTGSRPASIAFSPDGALLASADSGAKEVSAFTVSSSGRLRRVHGSPFRSGLGPQSLAFSPTGTVLAVANDGANTISAFAVRRSGVLTRVAGSPFRTGKNPSSVSFSHGGSLLADANSGRQSLSVFSVSRSGALHRVRGTPFAMPSNPASVAFDQSGPLLASTNVTADSLSVSSVPASGQLSPVMDSPYSLAPAGGPGAVAFTPNGRFAATVDRATDEVSVFARKVLLGYAAATSEGNVYAFGELKRHGSDAGRLGSGVTVVAMAFDRGTGGYWLLKSNGGISGLDAPSHGSLKGKLGGTRPVAIVPSGAGYLILTANGAVHPYGGASFHGSDRGKLRRGVKAVGLAVHASMAAGYWILLSDGGVDAFDTKAGGSLKGKLDGSRPVAIAPSIDNGYLILTSDGAVHPYGGAVYHGSDKGRLRHGVTAIGIESDPATNGYWLLKSNGGIDGFDAVTAGSLVGDVGARNRPVAITAGPPEPGSGTTP